MAAHESRRVVSIEEYLRRNEAGAPKVPRLLLGIMLRDLRKRGDITPKQAARQLGTSASTISRLELGHTGCKLSDVAKLLALYGVHDEENTSRFMTLARQANRVGWWQEYGPLVPDWFTPMIALESAASHLRCYQTQFVPGLLQTDEYCQAVARMGHPFDDAPTIRRRAEVRRRRQLQLERPNPPHLWAVLDQAILERPFGGAAVMRRQCEHLLELSELPHVTLQILPFSKGGAAAGTPITHVRFALDELADMVYLEQMNGATYHQEQDIVERYRWLLETMAAQAETPKATRGYLAKATRAFR
jgi:transcriptional regulator with XRE-family HTH domain